MSTAHSNSSKEDAAKAEYGSPAEKINTTWDDSTPIDAEMDKLLNRKFDRRVLPWLFGMWLLSFIDRTNIGNAKIDGILTDLNIATGLKFNTALAIFYVPYILVDVPSNLVLKHFKAGYYLPFILTCWGIVGCFMGFVKSYGGLLAARFFLGMCEGGLLGGMILYLSMFYQRHAMLWRVGLFYCAAPLSGAFGGLLATGLAQISTPGYNGWPFIFFVEGGITIFFGIISAFFLPDTPGSCKFLTAEQRTAAIDRMKTDSQGQQKGDVDSEKFDWHWVKMALLDVNVQMLSLIFFLIITPIYSYSLFLPTIIKTFGYSKVVTQLFTVPPNALAFFTVLGTCWLSDRQRQRGVFMLVGCTVALVGYIMLIASPMRGVQYTGTFLVAAGIFPCSPLVMAWLSNNLAPHYVRATGTGYQIMIANLAAFVATFTYIDADAPRYTAGHAINIGMIGAAIMCITILIFYNKAENRKRENGHRDDRLVSGSEDRLGSRHPRFKLTL